MRGQILNCECKSFLKKEKTKNSYQNTIGCRKRKKDGERKMKKIYCLFFILSLTINFLFFLTLIKGIFIQQNANRNNIKLKKVFSDATFDLITENKKNAAKDFTVLARNNKNQESIFCVINNQKRINISWDFVCNKKCAKNFAWEEQFCTVQNSKPYYKLTRNNVQYFSYSSDLIWTYKTYREDGKIHFACFYKGRWEEAEFFNPGSLTFSLKNSIKVQWSFEKQDWEIL